jgi:hypothetical protein
MIGPVVLSPEDRSRFCLADPVFFERPELVADEADRFPVARLAPPRGWRRAESGWFIRLWPGSDAPPQTWLVHVAVRLAEVGQAAEIVWGYCVERGIPFRFVRSATTARYLNGDEADRFGGGKVITVYAADDEVLTKVLIELAVLVEGMSGPRVLGALVHGTGPLQVSHAAAGATEAVFRVPDGVSLPPVLVPRPDRAAGAFPYRVLRALKLGNRGGTYLAETRNTGAKVVLKEARPYLGLDRLGRDAVERQAAERRSLARVAGLACVPRERAHRVLSGHHFLEQEYVEGTSLFAFFLHGPLSLPEHSARETGRHTSWALARLAEIERALREIRSRGLRLGELNPKNIIVRPEGGIVIVDLESATELDDDHAPSHGDPGFAVPPGLTAEEAHRYLVSRLCLALFMPFWHVDPVKVPILAAAVRRHFPLPHGVHDKIVSGLLPSGRSGDDDAGALFAAETPSWVPIRDALIRGIHLTASLDRTDRLFPATPSGPRTLGGYSLDHGAAGVLYALHQAGAEVPGSYVRWLIEAVWRDDDPPPGLYDGLHGVAYTLDLLGYREEALAIVDRCRPHEQTTAANLAGGRAGIAFNLLYFAAVTGDHRFEDRALHLADRLDPVSAGPGAIGLLRGPAGIAALFCRLHQLTGDAGYLQRAERALSLDLARCTTTDGSVLLEHPTTKLPYLDGGSWGLAFVLPHLLAHRPDETLSALLTGIRRTCELIYVHHSGLLRGRAGGIATLAGFADPADSPALLTQIRRLAWHARSYRGALAFHGPRMPRLSMDLATGSAGVLLALAAVFEGAAVLPHIGPRPEVVDRDGKGGEHHDRDSRTAGAGGGHAGAVAL